MFGLLGTVHRTSDAFPPYRGKHSRPPYRRAQENARRLRQRERDANRRGAFEVGERVILCGTGQIPAPRAEVMGCSRRWVTVVPDDEMWPTRWPIRKTIRDRR